MLTGVANDVRTVRNVELVVGFSLSFNVVVRFNLSCNVDRVEDTEVLVLDGANVRATAEIDPEQSLNMKSLVAFECTQAGPQSWRLKDIAPMNMRFMSVTFDTSHFEISQLKDNAYENIPVMSVTPETSHSEMSLLNNLAPENIPLMPVALDTSQLEMLPLNSVLTNIRRMSVNLDTFQSPIGPYGPFKQTFLGRNSMHLLISLTISEIDLGQKTVIGVASGPCPGFEYNPGGRSNSSSIFNCVENAGVVVLAGVVTGVHTVRDIDPGERSNIECLLAFECTQAAPQSWCLNDVACMNMVFMLVTFDTSHFETLQ